MNYTAAFDAQQSGIEAHADLMDAIDGDPTISAEAAAELKLAQAALDAAKQAHADGDDETAAAKLKESMDHVARAIALLKQAMGE